MTVKHFERLQLLCLKTRDRWSYSEVLMYFGGGYAERFNCISRDRWKNFRDRFGPFKCLIVSLQYAFPPQLTILCWTL